MRWILGADRALNLPRTSQTNKWVRLKQTSEYVSNKQVRSEASCNSISTKELFKKCKDTFNFRKVSRYRKFECNFENLIDKTRSCILSQKESLEGFFQRKKYMEISFRYIRNLDSRHSHGMYLKLSPTSLFFRLGLLYTCLERTWRLRTTYFF